MVKWLHNFLEGKKNRKKNFEFIYTYLRKQFTKKKKITPICLFFLVVTLICLYYPQITRFKSCCCCRRPRYFSKLGFFFFFFLRVFTVSFLFLNLHLRFQFDLLKLEDSLLDFGRYHFAGFSKVAALFEANRLELIFKSDGWFWWMALLFYWQAEGWRGISLFGVCDDLVGRLCQAFLSSLLKPLRMFSFTLASHYRLKASSFTLFFFFSLVW